MADTDEPLDDDGYLVAWREGEEVWLQVCGLDATILRPVAQRRLVRFVLRAHDGPNDLGALLEYWRSPTGAALAPPGMVELARQNIADLAAEVSDLRARLEEAHLYGIEGWNPGIDMDAVRASRAAGRPVADS